MAGIFARRCLKADACNFIEKSSQWQLTGFGGESWALRQLLILLFLIVRRGHRRRVYSLRLGNGRFPMQSAKHVRGRRVMGGTRQYLPLKGESGRRYADHFRQQLVDAAGAIVRRVGDS